MRIQAKTPNEKLGKVMAIMIATSHCVAPIGQFAYGVAFEGFGTAEYIPAVVGGRYCDADCAIGKRGTEE